MERLKYLLGIFAAGVLAAANTGGGNRALQMKTIGRTPLSFQQIDQKNDAWIASGRGYKVVLGSGSANIQLNSGKASAAVEMRLIGANSGADSEAQQPLPGKVNYLIGSDPKRWKTGISTFGRVKYHDIYRNTDVIWYGNQGELEYDFRLRPGSDPAFVALGFDRAAKLKIEPNGDLRIGVGDRHITLRAPSIYQEIAGVRKNISGRYELRAENEVSFRIGSYDKSSTLVIDPSIAYSSYYGSDLTPNSIAVDSSGNVYIGGSSDSGYVPVAAGDNVMTSAGLGSESGVITKFNSSGAVVWSTFIGGSGQDAIYGIAIDSSGDVFATGSASSTDFPVVNAAQISPGDGFALELSAGGSSLTYSTYLGGSQGDYGSGIAVDAGGNAYLTGVTYNTVFMGVTTGTTEGEAFVVKLSSTGALASSFPVLLGSKTVGNAITADSTGAYITGGTAGTSFTGISSPGPQHTSGGGYDAFIMKVSSSGSSTWATFLGGSGDETGNAITSDGTNLYVAGWTSSSNLPVLNALQGTLKGSENAFIASLDVNGTAFRFVTYLGGSNYDSASSIALDPNGALVVAGNTGSPDFPIQNAIQPAFPSDASLFYYSQDSGSTWTPSRGLGTAYVLSNVSPDPATQGTIVATEQANGSSGIVNAIVRTTNYGQTWQTVYPSVNAVIYSLARDPANPNMLYAVDSSNHILRSGDDGESWTLINTVSSTNNIVTVTKNGTVLVFGYDTANRVFRSTNNGATFSAVTPGFASASIVTPTYAAAAGDGPVFVQTSGGMYESDDDGSTWAYLSGAPSGMRNLAFGHGVSTALYAADCTSVYSSTNAGSTWTALPGAAGDAICYVAGSTSTTNIYGVTQSGDVFVSTDNGNTWALTGTGVDNQAITGILLDAFGDVYLTSQAGGQTGFVTSMATSGGAVNWSTFFGDSGQATAFGSAGFMLQAVAPATNFGEGVWVSGQGSLNLPVTTSNTNGLDGGSSFIARLSNSTPSCTYSINPGSQYVYTTGTIYFSVTAPSGCQWTATADQSWISFKAGSSGTGSGTVVVRAQGNNGPATGHINIEDQSSNVVATFDVTEPAAGCTYSVSNPSGWGAQDGTGSITLTVTPASDCTWDAQAVSGSSTVTTSGNTVTVALPANGTINPQQYQIEVAGQIVTIDQASTCSYTGFPNGGSLSPNPSGLAGSGTLSGIVASPAACSVNAISDQSWLTVTNSGSTISYSYTGNYTGASRTGHIIMNGQIYTITQAATSALQFVPITPCRIVETRSQYNPTTSGPFAAGSIPSNGTRSFPLLQSTTCAGIPADAAAFSLNVTVVPHGSLGYISIWPSDRSQPVVSTLNSTDGRVKADAVIVPGSADGTGSVSVYAENETDILFDLNGYFVPATDNSPSALAFYPITPCRVADTRPPSQSGLTYPTGLGQPSFSAGQTRDFPIASSQCLSSIPSGVQPLAYSLNLTVVPPAPLGFITVWPSDQPQPTASTLNAPLVGNPPMVPYVANAAIVKAAATSGNGFNIGDIMVYATNATDLLIDINGYFAAPGNGGLSFYPATPCRVWDSRNPNNQGPPVSGQVSVKVESSSCAPPAAAQAYVFNATVLPDPTLGFLALWPDLANGTPVAQPLVSTLNAIDGYFTSNMAIVPTGGGNINAYTDGTAAVILDYSGFFAP